MQNISDMFALINKTILLLDTFPHPTPSSITLNWFISLV